MNTDEFALAQFYLDRRRDQLLILNPGKHVLIGEWYLHCDKVYCSEHEVPRLKAQKERAELKAAEFEGREHLDEKETVIFERAKGLVDYSEDRIQHFTKKAADYKALVAECEAKLNT